MPLAQAYPASRHEVPTLIDLFDRVGRARLSSYAARAFFNVMECWRIRDKDAGPAAWGHDQRCLLRTQEGERSGT